MWWNKKTDDTLEWTVSEAGFDDAPEVAEDSAPPTTPAAPVGPSPRPSRFPWRRVGWLAAPALLILAGVWAWSQWTQWQTRREVEQALIGEVAAPPRPLSFLTWDETQSPRLGAVEQLDVNTLRADAVHTFLAPDGQRYAFAMPRFFSRAGESWLPSDPPDSFPGEIRQSSTPRLTLRYYAADAELVEQTIAPYLDRVLGQVCVEWECARPAALSLTERREAVATDIELNSAEPLLFWLLASRDAQTLTQIAAPHVGGYPADEASRNLWLRTLALRAFAQLGLNEVFPEVSSELYGNTFLHAILAREAVSYNLELPAVRDYGLADDNGEQSLLQRFTEMGQLSSEVEQAEQRRDALTLLNRFARQWPEVDQSTFWRDAPAMFLGGGPITWLVRRSQRDGQPLSEWVNDWREVLGQPPSQVMLPGGDLMLNCFTGPQFYGADGLKPLLPLSELPIPAYSLVGWSPTGRYVPLGLGFQASVLDTQTGLLHLPPDDANTLFAVPLDWASDSVLAYISVDIASIRRSDAPDPDAYQLRFFDVADSARDLPPVSGIGIPFGFGLSTYIPSPDRQWAAVLLGAATEQDIAVTLDLMPTLGSERQTLAQQVNTRPAWSPDGRELAFTHWDAASESLVLHVYSLDTGQTRLVWDSQAWEVATFRGQTQALLAWSGDGRWIALAMQSSSSNTIEWLGLIASDGDATLRLDAPAGESLAGVSNWAGFPNVPPGTLNSLAFSSDGRYLALSGAFPEPQLLIYDVAARRILRALPGGSWSWLQWSPDDRQLLLAGNGVTLLNDPLNPRSPIEQLADGESCLLGSWKPD